MAVLETEEFRGIIWHLFFFFRVATSFVSHVLTGSLRRALVAVAIVERLFKFNFLLRDQLESLSLATMPGNKWTVDQYRKEKVKVHLYVNYKSNSTVAKWTSQVTEHIVIARDMKHDISGTSRTYFLILSLSLRFRKPYHYSGALKICSDCFGCC